MSATYHYTECGLPNVYLKNGYTLESIDSEIVLEEVDHHWLKAV